MRIPPRAPLGLRILMHAPRRLLVSVAGIMLAIVLMFSQSGFRNGVLDSQAELIERLNGELIIVGRLKSLWYVEEPFPSRRLYQARTCPGVQNVYPLYLETSRAVWHNTVDNSTRAVRVIAYNPDDPVIDVPEVRAYAAALKMPDTVLFDEKARDLFGRPQAGTQTELSRRKITVVGTFRLGTDILTDANLIMSDRNFAKFFPAPYARTHLDEVTAGIVKLAPGAKAETVKRQLTRDLPDDVKVLTKPELVEMEMTYWRENTATGIIFGLGMAVGFAVGIVICYQVLYSSVSSYLPQFATLKAMGFSDAYLVGVVLQQALFLSILGFIPALAAVQGLFMVVGNLTGLLLFLTVGRIAFIFVLTVAMCMVSGIIAVRRVVQADPAEVFR